MAPPNLFQACLSIRNLIDYGLKHVHFGGVGQALI
jgi:hypothetical protein